MNKRLLIFLLTCTLNTHHTSPMEKDFNEDEWETITATTKTTSQADWENIREIISNHINSTYVICHLTNPSLNSAWSIIKTPEELFPELINNFNNIFFTNICSQNKIFNQAINRITEQSKQELIKSLTGSTIDCPKISFLSKLCPTIQQFIFDKTYKKLKEKQSYTLNEHKKFINTIHINSQTKCLASGSEDKTARIFNLLTGKQVHELSHTSSVNTVSFNTDGSQLATATESAIIAIWDTTNGTLLHTLDNNKYKHNNASFSDKNNVLFTWKTIEYIGDGYWFCDSLSNLWQCFSDKPPLLLSSIQIPMRKTYTFTKSEGMDYKAERTGLLCQTITFTKEDHFPNLCTIAFSNSKQDKHALKGLLSSKTLNNLDDIDKLPLVKSINDQLLKLSQEKKMLKTNSQTQPNELELQIITNPYQ